MLKKWIDWKKMCQLPNVVFNNYKSLVPILTALLHHVFVSHSIRSCITNSTLQFACAECILGGMGVTQQNMHLNFLRRVTYESLVIYLRQESKGPGDTGSGDSVHVGLDYVHRVLSSSHMTV